MGMLQSLDKEPFLQVNNKDLEAASQHTAENRLSLSQNPPTEKHRPVSEAVERITLNELYKAGVSVESIVNYNSIKFCMQL